MPRLTLALCAVVLMTLALAACTDDAQPLPPKAPTPPTPTAEKPAERKPDKPIMEGSPTIEELSVRKRPGDR